MLNLICMNTPEIPISAYRHYTHRCLSFSETVCLHPLPGIMTAHMLSLMIRVVIDTNVFVAAMRSEGGASRAVLKNALTGHYVPLFGNALWLEYEAMLGRPIWTNETSDEERRTVMAALARQGRWVSIYYGWRPNLPDEGDNHLVELALAGNANAIVTHNISDLKGGELAWPDLHILKPSECLEAFK